MNQLGKLYFLLGKAEFWTYWEFCAWREIFCLNKGPKYLYLLSNVLTKHKKRAMKTFQVQVYIQQWFRDKEGAKFMENLTFSL